MGGVTGTLETGARPGWQHIIRFAALILVAQILFWGLFNMPWGKAPGDLDRIDFDRVTLAELQTPTPQAADAATYRAVELPYTDCCDPAYLSLRLRFTLADVPADGLGLVAFQQVDNFIIRANGSVIHQLGRMEFGQQSFHGQRPYLVRIPAGMLRAGENELSFITVRHGYPYTDLLPPLLAPYDQVREATASRFWQMIDYRMLGGWLTFILGLLALVMVFRSADRRFAGWLVALCWAWTGFAIYGLYFDLPFGGVGRMIAFFAVNTLLVASLSGFIDAWTRRPLRGFQAACLALWAAFNLAAVALFAFGPTATAFDLLNTGWSWFSLTFGLAAIVRLLWHFATVVEDRRFEAALLSVCAVCAALDGIGEHFGLAAGGYLMDAAPLLLLTFFVVFLQRNFTLFRSAVELNQLLETTVHAREAELAAAHARERDLVSRDARDKERRRLMRDMHDGVGGELVGLLLAVRRGKMDQQRLAEGLEGVMDEIRLMLDSVDTAVTSLATMLDLFAARVGPRVEGAGFRFAWENMLARDIDLPPRDVLQLFRIMQEAVTNALKHSGGDTIAASVSSIGDDALEVVITDNGRGNVPHTGSGHGMSNMRSRAQMIGSTLTIEEGAPGAVVRIRVPLPETEKRAA